MKNIFILLILVIGLISTSLIKNKTRLLEKDLVKLKNEISTISYDLNEASLDFEYLTTPKNITFLAKNYLDEDLFYYKKSQIKNLSVSEKTLITLQESGSFKKEEDLEQESDLLKDEKKEDLAQESDLLKDEKKEDLAHLENSQNNEATNTLILRRPSMKDSYNKENVDAEEIYKTNNDSKNILDSQKVKKWAGFQVIKALLGVPVVPVK